MTGSDSHGVSRKRKILLVDDSPTDRYLIQSSFQESGMSCEWFVITHGGEAIRIGTSNQAPFQPDVILLDGQLPGANGLEVLTALKRNAIWAATPVIMLTGNQSPLYRKSAHEAGACDVLEKPFDLDEWMKVPAQVENVLASAA